MKAKSSYRPSLFSQLANLIPITIDRRILLWLAVAGFTLATGYALYQPVHPDPWHVHDGWDRFIYPQEKNAFLRQPSLSTNININDITSINNKIWAVGDGGLILYSDDGGLCWTTQGPWVKTTGQSNCPQPKTGLQRIFSGLSATLDTNSLLDSIIPPAHAAEAPTERRPTSNLKQDFNKQPLKREINPNIQQNIEAQIIPEKPIQIDFDVKANVDVAIKNVSPVDQNLKSIPDLQAIAFFDSKQGIAVGDNGVIVKTNDSGNSWIKINAGTQKNLISISFPSRNVAIALLENGSILHSNDAGLSWSADRQRSGYNIYALEFISTDQAVAISENGSILLSTDGAITWREVNPRSNNRLYSISASNNQLLIAVGENGIILRSVDAGLTWTKTKSATQARLYSSIFSSNNQVIAVGEKGTILYSSDSGESWVARNYISQETLTAITATTQDQVIAVGIDGTIIHSRNSGQDWVAIESGKRARLYSLAFSSTNHVVAVGGKDTILGSSDAGLNWSMLKSETPSRLYSIAFSAKGQAIAVGRDGTILRSVDKGKSWSSIDSEVKTRLNSATFNGANLAFAVGDNGTVIRSNNAGLTWERKNTVTPEHLYSIDFSSSNKAIAAGEKGIIIRSPDNGESWSIVDSGTDNILHSIMFLSNNVAIALGKSGTILRSTDAGITWKLIKSATRETLRSLAYSSNGQTIAVGDNGIILRSSDSGNSWSRVDSGTISRLYTIAFSISGLAIAAGRDGVILRSNDDGESWHQVFEYRVNLAIWWYLLMAISIGLGLFAVWPRLEQAEDDGIAGLAASDRPLQPGDPDALNLGSIAADITTFLSNPKTTAPLTMAITGPWGSGKSSLMNLVQADLKQRGFSPVWFNAWHHQKGEQLLASLFAHIKQQAIPSLFSFDGLWFRLKLAFIRSYRHWFVFAVLMGLLFFTLSLIKAELKSVFDKLILLQNPDYWWHIPWENWMPNLQTFFQSGDWIQTLASIFGIGTPLVALIRSFRGFGINPRKLVSIDHNPDHTKGYDPGARARFAKEFNDVTHALGNNKMVIFIDDLDRCSQENLIDILENINFIASSGDCFMLLGMAPKYIEACVANAYETLAQSIAAKEKYEKQAHIDDEQTHKFRFAHNYLEKMINIEVTVPQMQGNSIDQLFNLQSRANEKRDWKTTTASLLQTVNKSAYVVLPVVIILLAIGYGWEYGRKIPDKPKRPDRVSYDLGTLDRDTLLALSREKTALQTTRKLLDDKTTNDEIESSKFLLSLHADEKQITKGIKITTLGKGEEKADLVLKLNPESKKAQIDSTPKADEGPGDDLAVEKTARNQAAEFRQAAFETGGRLSALKLLLGLLLFASFAYYLYRKKKDKYADDSDDFKEALITWTPWIQSRQETPRAVKRFLNHLRFLAIRNKRALNESILVAMATIYFYNPDWLLDDAKFKALCESQLFEVLTDEYQLEKQQKGQYETLKASLAALSERLNEVLNTINIEQLKENRDRAITILSGALPITQDREVTPQTAQSEAI